MSMFTRSDRASVKPPGSGEKFPLWLNLKTGHRVAGWYDPINGRYMKSPAASTADPSIDVHDQVDTWEVRRNIGARQ